METNVIDRPSPSAPKPANQAKMKAGSKKPFFIRDLVKAQIQTDSRSNTLGSKRKLTDDGDRCAEYHLNPQPLDSDWMKGQQ